jgi:hypothetical protein
MGSPGRSQNRQSLSARHKETVRLCAYAVASRADLVSSIVQAIRLIDGQDAAGAAEVLKKAINDS